MKLHKVFHVCQGYDEAFDTGYLLDQDKAIEKWNHQACDLTERGDAMYSRLTLKRNSGLNPNYWTEHKKQEIVNRLGQYEDSGLSPALVQTMAECPASQMPAKDTVEFRWIPIVEQLPATDEEILITVSGFHNTIYFENAVMLAYYDVRNREWIVSGFEEWENPSVSAWMPAPEPYREVE